MNDTTMTVVGNVVGEPRLRRTANGNEVANFRIASTSRRYDREEGKFVDNATLFVTVTCWRQLGANVARSLRKGQPVVVTGRFTMREYKVDEQLRTSYELEAVAVGHDLSRGTAEFTRVYATDSPVTVERDPDGVPVDESDRWLGIVTEPEFDGAPADEEDDSVSGGVPRELVTVS